MDSGNFQANIYPILKVSPNLNPKKLYAIPLLGMLIKGVMLIPAVIVLFALTIASGVLVLCNAFMVLFTGKYWKTAYDLVLGTMRYSTKITLFTYGITDKYPGFDSTIEDQFSLDIAMPTTPDRLYAIPLIGMLIRVILLIPFSIFTSIIDRAASIGIFLGAWAPVLFSGRYPESTFELGRDSLRLSLSQMAYGFGLSDQYPSFNISWNHQGIKIALIIVSALVMVFQFGSGMLDGMNKANTPPKIPTNYSNTYSP